MREIRSYGSVGVPAGNCWHYPAKNGRTELEGTLD